LSKDTTKYGYDHEADLGAKQKLPFYAFVK
jgi:hypothetical protein